MIDLGYIESKGAIKLKRCRAIWDDGYLHTWPRKGRYRRYRVDAPQKVGRKDYRAWVPGVGYMSARRKCGCGVPLRIRMRSAKRLMAEARLK